MDRRLLFMEAFQELDALTAKSQALIGEYELLRIAALLRLLILDGEPLVEQVNREHRIKILFRSSYPASMTEEDLPEPPFGGADTPLPIGTKSLSRQNFLKRYAGFIRPYSHTIKDIILYGANVAGGVHAGQPRTPEHATISGSAGIVQISGKEPALLELLGIGQVVVRGLELLYRLVQASQTCGCPKPAHMSCDVLILVEESTDAVAPVDLADPCRRAAGEWS